MAEQGIIRVLSSDDPATLDNPQAGVSWFGVDAIGFWIKDSGGTVVRPDVGTGINFTELFTAVPFAINNVWTVVSLGAPFANALVDITMKSVSNNTTAGVREVGSVLVRLGIIDADSIATLPVRCDANGDIELFASTAANVAFLISAQWQ